MKLGISAAQKLHAASYRAVDVSTWRPMAIVKVARGMLHRSAAANRREGRAPSLLASHFARLASIELRGRLTFFLAMHARQSSLERRGGPKLFISLQLYDALKAMHECRSAVLHRTSEISSPK